MKDESELRITVLIVEHETLARVFAADILDQAGFKLFEGVSAEEALTILEARPDIQVVLTAVEIPGPMTGFDLARAVHERRPEVQMIATSERTHLLGEDWPENVPFVARPYLPSIIVGLIKNVVGPPAFDLEAAPFH